MGSVNNKLSSLFLPLVGVPGREMMNPMATLYIHRIQGKRKVSVFPASETIPANDSFVPGSDGDSGDRRSES